MPWTAPLALAVALAASAPECGGSPGFVAVLGRVRYGDGIAGFDGDACRGLAADTSRPAAERVAGLLGILDARLRDWADVAAGTRTAVEGRDDRGRELGFCVSALSVVLREEASAGRFKEGPPALEASAGERKLLEPAALAPLWDLACLLGGARAEAPASVVEFLAAESDGNLLALALKVVEGRCPPAAVPAVLRLLDHPFKVKTTRPKTPWTWPVRDRAARVLASLGVRVETAGTVHTVVQTDLAALCRKWLRSAAETEWRGALAIVRAVGRGPCVNALSMEMAEPGVPLEKLEAMSQALEAVEQSGGGAK